MNATWKMAVLPASLLVALSAAAVWAQPAQRPEIPESAFRPGQEPVLEAPQQPKRPSYSNYSSYSDPAFDPTAFANAYAKAERPTIAVLWNREYTDLLQDGSVWHAQVSSSTAGAAQVDKSAGPGWASGSVSAAGARVTDITVAEQRLGQAARGGPSEPYELRARAAFMQTMTANGVRLVDRNVVMRSTAASRTDDKLNSLDSLNSQRVETEALGKNAQLLMEVLFTPDRQAGTGWSMFLSIKRMSDGIVLSEGFMEGNLPAQALPTTPTYEANPAGGYRKVATPALQPHDQGKLLAEQTLIRLTEALAR